MHERLVAALTAALLVLATACTKIEQVRPARPGTDVASPSAATAPEGARLPRPDPPFGGVIAESAQQSTPWWPPTVRPPDGAPSVLLILTDDAGFGVPSTFGGVIPTPTMERLANQGLRYTRVFSTALCSPTRAALLTGRNHHSAGFGVIIEQATGYPGYDSLLPRDKATIGRILRDNGYSTGWFGKAHNTPAFQASGLGPFDQWPTGLGFDYFYGFVGGDTSQWHPNLFRNTTRIYPFEDAPPGTWNLVTAMADDAIDHLTRMHQIDPSRPFFIQYAPGATHAPHHPTKEWVDRIQAMHLFDDGYEKLRERIFDNQKRLGVIPADTRLPPWPKDLLKPWDQLTADEKRLFVRQVEVFAAYAAYNDHEIGRVVQHLEDLGRLDDTLVVYINGDNGTSGEGGPLGTPNEVAFFNGVNQIPVEDQLERVKWEGPEALTPGRHRVEFAFEYEGLGVGTLAFDDFSGVGQPGVGTLKVDGRVVATKRMPRTLPTTVQWNEAFDIGSDTLTGVNDADYQPPFPLTAELVKLTIAIDRPTLSPEDIQRLDSKARD